jgi:hypothetical protein
LFSFVLGACSEKPRTDNAADSSVHSEAGFVSEAGVGSEAGVAVTAQPLLAPPFDVTLTATADSYIAQGTSTFNFGTSTAIDVTGVALSGWEAGLVSFDDTAIKNVWVQTRFSRRGYNSP